MPRLRAAQQGSVKSGKDTGCGKRVYVFRCDESGLFAFTADREGSMLPSQLYPQISWHFEHVLVPRYDGNSARDKILRATLDGVAKRGFHLVHAALYGELLGFLTHEDGTSR